MIKLLTTARRVVKQAALSVVAPARLFTDETTTAPEPAGLYGPDEMPDAELIEAAAAEYDRAADQARRADRGKRAAKKVLDRLPAGTYGAWKVERQPSNRQVADLEQIARIFKAHGLGPVPMKSCAASLKVTRVAAAPVAGELVAA